MDLHGGDAEAHPMPLPSRARAPPAPAPAMCSSPKPQIHLFDDRGQWARTPAWRWHSFCSLPLRCSHVVLTLLSMPAWDMRLAKFNPGPGFSTTGDTALSATRDKMIIHVGTVLSHSD